MKKKRLIIATGAVFLVLSVSLTIVSRPGALPVLVFKGYTSNPTNASRIANFELRNLSRSTIWLCYAGSESPLAAPFLERPVVALPETNNAPWKNLSLSVGSYFITSGKLLPGRNLLLVFPLAPDKPVSTVSIVYYSGRFSDPGDFLENLGTFGLSATPSLKDRAAYYWQMAKRSFRAPKRREAWCTQAVSFQAAVPSVERIIAK